MAAVLATENPFVGSRKGDQLCVTYPNGEGVTLDSRSLRISYSRTNHSELVTLPADLDPAEWTRIALQIRPDGDVSLFANGEFLWRVGFPIAVREGDSWRLVLFGASVDTEALVRSVTVWRGTRYPEPPAGR